MAALPQDAGNVDVSSLGSLLSSSGGAALGDQLTWNSLWAAIATAFVSFGVQLIVFQLLRWRLIRIYRPRTYLVPERERVPIPPHGIIGWIKPVFATPALQIIQKCGLDAYFFVRYLRMLLKVFTPMLVIIMPILLPINRYSTSEAIEDAQTGLNILTIANVGAQHAGGRLWAHVVLAVLSIVWVMYNIYHELRSYIRVRQAYLTSPQHRIRASATTVLVAGIPAKWLTTQALDGLYDVYPGGIRNIWINRNYDQIADKVSKRDNLVQNLEEAETNLVRKCWKKHEKALKKQAKSRKSGSSTNLNDGQEMSDMGDGTTSSTNDQEKLTTPPNVRSEPPRIPSNYAEAGGRIPKPPNTAPVNQDRPSDEQPLRDSQETATEAVADATHEPKEISGQVMSGSKWYEWFMFWDSDPVTPPGGYPSVLSEKYDDDKDEHAAWRRYIEPKDRETIRLPIVQWNWFPALPWIGKKVDRIYHCRKELARLNSEIEADQDNSESFPYMSSAFIQFNNQIAAHMACQSVSHHVPHTMTPRIVEIAPDDVIWDNMSIKWWERYIRIAIVVVLSAALTIFYAVPVTFTTLLSSISTLAQQVHWLAWLNDFPKTAKSIIQGVLPPALIQLLLIVVPMIYRGLVTLQGVPTGNARELGVQKWYFLFLFIQLFFVVTVSSGILGFITDVSKDAVSAVTNFATNLPKASNYFFKYLVIRSLSSAAGELVQIGTLIGWFIIGSIFDSTPRDKWKRQTNLSQIKWGSFFAPFTNFAVIGIVYSIFAPLILIFMLLIFGIFWFVYRYNILYVYQFKNDTGGLLFPTAVFQLFTGVYVLEVCLAAYLFSRESDTGSKVVCLPHALVMVVVLVFTVIYHRILVNNFSPLLRYLPITLEDDAVIRDEEFARVQAARFSTSEEPRPMSDEEGDANFEKRLKERERDEENEAPGPDTPSLKRADTSFNRSFSRSSTPSNSWAKRTGGSHKTWQKAALPVKGIIDLTARAEKQVEETVAAANAAMDRNLARANGAQNPEGDEEGQRTVADVLFAGIADELEDLSPDDRNSLVRYAFLHSALRARRPVVWIPKDELGVSEDEIARSKTMSDYLALSNQGTDLDKKGKVAFHRSPPDFSNVDLIAL